jgi:hypothetical protein
MYYTAKLFEQNLQPECHITTGYIDRKVYDECPLTHSDFKQYLDSKRKYSNYEKKVLANTTLSTYIFNKIYVVLSYVVYANVFKICNNTSIKKDITFQLFGCDIAINDDLSVQIMEINKGPDMGAKDNRDKAIKFSVFEDMLTILKLTNLTTHNFIKLFEIDKKNNHIYSEYI